jgi:hypothetical protein
MDMAQKDRFTALWGKHFGDSDLPMAFYYTAEPGAMELARAPAAGHQCLVPLLSKVRRGSPLAFDVTGVGCSGGKRYLGFSQEIMPNFEYFLSCGIPGQMEGERYKKSPELVREVVKRWPRFEAPARFIVFKRWDQLEEPDLPAVAIFFSPPDVLSGLFTLANFDEVGPGVFAPFCAGCASIVQFPFLERDARLPRAVLGMFDVSARPYVPAQTLSFAVPMSKFWSMVENMEESFLTTPSWAKVKTRIGKKG